MSKAHHHWRLPFLTLCVVVAGCSQPSSVEEDPVILSSSAALAASCSGCHMPSNTAIPDYSELSEAELSDALLFYKQDSSGSTVMHRIMRGYSDTEIAELSIYLAGHDD